LQPHGSMKRREQPAIGLSRALRWAEKSSRTLCYNCVEGRSWSSCPDRKRPRKPNGRSFDQ